MHQIVSHCYFCLLDLQKFYFLLFVVSKFSTIGIIFHQNKLYLKRNACKKIHIFLFKQLQKALVTFNAIFEFAIV
jgi:hypothetical protein